MNLCIYTLVQNISWFNMYSVLTMYGKSTMDNTFEIQIRHISFSIFKGRCACVAYCTKL